MTSKIDFESQAYIQKKYYHYIPLEVYPQYHFEAKDVGIAAALLCKGIELHSVLVTPHGEPSIVFTFDYEAAFKRPEDQIEMPRPETPEEIVEKYVAGTLQINVKSFFGHLRGLEGELQSQYGK